MSSGFVSGGSTEYTPGNDSEWQKVKQELDESRKRRAEQGAQEGGKSLYEVLQQNKAAKQEAFEESIRLKNQFRALDEDEVEFLDSVLESTRAKEEAVKKETMEQLEMFHRQREEAEKKAFAEGENTDKPGAGSPTEEEQWTIPGRKRRRAQGNDVLPGVKLRKSSSSASHPATSEKSKDASKPETAKPDIQRTEEPLSKAANSPKPSGPLEKPVQSAQKKGAERPASTNAKAAPAVATALGLGAYSSDED